MEGYCLKCKEKRAMVDPVAEWAANGSPGTRGKCPVCGTTIYKRGATPAHESLPKDSGTVSPTKERSVSSKTGKGKKSAGTKTTSVSSSKKATPVSTTPTQLAGKLVVVESPAKAKTIGRYLGRGYTVKSSVGHVRDLLKSKLSVDVEHNFTPQYRVPDEKKEVVRELRAAAAKAKEIYLATDPDREGEAIAWHVRESAEMDAKRTKRVVFHEITKSAIEEAFQHPRQIDMNRVDAQQARRILDRLVGYKLSPLLWRKVRWGLSAGRVQSVAVRLVVEREREITSFIPQEYWLIKADLSQQKYRQKKQRPAFVAKLHRYQGKEPVLDSETVVKPHLERLQKAHWIVGSVKLGKRQRRPSPPFTTSTLQQDASRSLGFGTSKTMQIAQQLYEGVEIGAEGSSGLITYMRTDSVTVSKEAEMATRNFITQNFGADYVPAQPPVYKTRSKTAQEAHEAIRPTVVARTPQAIKPFLSRDQHRLYELIWKRFVASQMAAAVYDTVTADIGAGEATVPAEKRPYLFRATGSTLVFAGFLALYEESREENGEEEESRVPSDLKDGELLDLLKLLPEQHFTQPPPRFSEATLVKELEENEIGRPSTYASIISTILDRGYVQRENKKLIPTETGALVNDLLVSHFPEIISTDFTAQLEDELDKIANGKEWVPVIRTFYDQFATDLAKADEDIAKVDVQKVKKELEPVGRDCPVCGKPLVYRESRFGRFIGCSDYPKCRHIEQILKKVGVSCPKDGGDIVEKRAKKGRKLFYGCANYPNCDWTSWKKPVAQPCHNCGGLVVETAKATGECTQCGTKQPLPN